MTCSHSQIQTYLKTLIANEKVPDAVSGQVFGYGFPVGAAIEYHQRLDRCMIRLRTLIREAEKSGGVLPNGTVVIAETLSGSSGRFDRYWHAPPGGIWLAMAWADTLLPQFAGLLPMVTGIASCETLRYLGLNAQLKWVNDVMVDGHKICGILCESMVSELGDRYHLLGVGMNINNQSFPQELASIAGSVAGLTGEEADLQQVTIHFLARLSWNIGMLHYEEALSLAQNQDAQYSTVNRWQQLSDTVGRRVLYGYDVQKKPQFEARVVGIEEGGGLCLQLSDGTLTRVYSGELVYL